MRVTVPLLRLLAALHARGLHAAVLAGLVMAPAVVAAGFLSDKDMWTAAPIVQAMALRGSLDPATP